MSDRHTFRAEWHDYNSGIYFVTICSKDKRHIFVSIYEGKMKFSAIGNIINECLMAIASNISLHLSSIPMILTIFAKVIFQKPLFIYGTQQAISRIRID